jgi:hypothetical protein
MADAAANLNPEAEAYYQTLAPGNYPKLLIEAYPRIANQIVALHDDRDALSRYFVSLLADERGNRQGFAFPILVEIQNLFDTMVGIPGGFTNTNALLHELLKK